MVRKYGCCFVLFFLCLVPAAVPRADTAGNGNAVVETIPQSGFYYDRRSLILYCNGKPVDRVPSAAEREKFRLHPYAKFLSYDRERGVRLYCEGENAWLLVWGFSMSTVDSPRSFRVVGPNLAYDENRTYYIGRAPAGPLPDAPHCVFSFMPLEGSPSIETLTVMPDPRYLKGGSMVYYCGQPIPDADPGGFVTLSAGHPSIKIRKYNLDLEDFEYFEAFDGIAADSRHVYLGGRVLPEIPVGADFRVLCRYLIATDREVYFVSHNLYKIRGADPLTMRTVGTHYSRDKARVFFHSTPMTADPKSFLVIDGYYSRDQEHVFYQADPVPGADPRTFTVLDRGYAGDGRKVYWRGLPVKQAEPEGFELFRLSAAAGIELKHGYLITEEDFCFAHDGKRVFFSTDIIPGADPKTFDPVAYYKKFRDAEKKKLDELYNGGKIRY
jgi:hypothetical protein